MATNSPLRAPSMSKKQKTDVKRGVKAASKVKVKQGRKRNSLLDMATEWMKVNPGATLQESLLAAGFNAIDANSKNYRDQLSRRLRNDRRAEEEGVLEKDEFVQKVKVSCVVFAIHIESAASFANPPIRQHRHSIEHVGEEEGGVLV